MESQQHHSQGSENTRVDLALIGLFLIAAFFLFTVLTLVMFPILVFMYVRLARREGREVLAEFGEAYARYMANTPAFFPRLSDGGAKHEVDKPQRGGR